MNKISKSILRFVLSAKIIFINNRIINIYFLTWHIRQGELNFHTDVARDFLVYEEIDQKKFILIGPRSSTSGLFHGPAWLYLTYPAYLLGNGNPVVMGWYWIFLIVIFLIMSCYAAKSLFGKTAGWIYVVLLSGNMIFFANNLFNPHGALFLMPFFLYSIIRYHETTKLKFLIFHLISGSLLIQFQMAVGIPLMILSIIYLLTIKIRRKNAIHLAAFLIFFALLGNFFLFEIRHDFGMTKAMLKYVRPINASGNRYDYSGLIMERIDQLMSIQLTQGTSAQNILAIFSLFSSLTLIIYFCSSVLFFLRLNGNGNILHCDSEG